jgi:two-component system, chemotaxis family, protein-glutamate methylesterase/glutaminase
VKERVRVVVVDDSAFARKVLSNVLNAERSIEVVGTARDGLEALERISELDPDVVTLDLVMPQLDGLGVLQALAGKRRPAVVVVSMSDAESEIGVSALQRGAVAVVHKPTGLATDRLYELGGVLVDKVFEAHGSKPHAGTESLALGTVDGAPGPWAVKKASELLLIGTSTGGPQALTALLPLLPADFPLPIAIVVHIPPPFTEALAARLDRASQISVVEASQGLEFGPGTAVLARGGQHLYVERSRLGARARLDLHPVLTPHRPAVDVLFESAARAFGAGALGVVLTGMGDDGLRGARAIVEKGGRLLTEAASSCVVHGMPRCVLEAGLSAADVPLPDMLAAIRRAL